MPVIQPMPWDSRKLGLPVGRLMDLSSGWTKQSLAEYGLVFARVPQRNREAIVMLQTCGFQYIGLDLSLVAAPDELAQPVNARWIIRRICHRKPDFQIKGFRIEESRLMLDRACRERLPEDFWDALIYEHCVEFADTVIFAVDTNNHLAGFISCLMRPSHLDLFMVAVQPTHQGNGLGGSLLGNAAALARERGMKLRTSVMTSNVRGCNFYLRHRFLVEDGEVVMHRWREGTQVV